MAVVDVFSIMFKSNAKEAEKDVKNLNETTQKAQDKFNEADKQASKLSDSLLKVGLQGLAAFASFDAIKNGISGALNLNLALEKTSQLYGGNVDELNAWNIAFSNNNAGTKDYLDFVNQMGPSLAQWGKSTEDLNKTFINLSKNMVTAGDTAKNLVKSQGGSLLEQQKAYEAAQRQYFSTFKQNSQLPVPESLFFLLSKGPDELLAAVAAGEQLNATTKKLAESALDYEKALGKVKNQWDGLWSPATDGAAYLLDLLQRLISAARTVGSVISHAFTGGAIYSGDSVQGAKDEAKAVDDINKVFGFFGINGGKSKTTAAPDVSLGGNDNVAKALARATKGSGDIGSYLSTDSKLNIIGNAQNYVKAADNSPTNSAVSGGGTTSLSIGNLTIQTLATDAKGIADDIGKSLEEQLHYLAARFNDGIAK